MVNNRNARGALGAGPRAVVLILVIVASVVAVAAIAMSGRSATGDQFAALTQPPEAGDYTYRRLDDPSRTTVLTGSGQVVATLTDGARTVALAGPSRTFVEPTDPAVSLTSATWVRLLPEPWRAGGESRPGFSAWLDATLRDRSPDLFDVALQYATGAPDESDDEGVRVRGDAGFGPEAARSNGRDENSDFYDYLGVAWTSPDGVPETADPTRYGDVDCSGYLRLVFGYRLGYPLQGTNAPGPGLPRRAYAMAESGPGTTVISDRGRQADEYPRLQPGDVVFFDIDPSLDRRIDHAGIYLGVDEGGHHRFLSSRAKVNGPTFGDVGGTSLLDDGGYYSTALRSARRL